jgi:hypothetical protein
METLIAKENELSCGLMRILKIKNVPVCDSAQNGTDCPARTSLFWEPICLLPKSMR